MTDKEVAELAGEMVADKEVAELAGEIVADKEVVDEKIENTLQSIFKKTGYPYNIRVYIKTKDKEYDTYLVARTKRKITTLDNEVIYLDEIEELKKISN